MPSADRRILFVFLDGVGVGPSDPSINPFFAAPLPVLAPLLSGSLPEEAETDHARAVRSFELDACLGVEGLPQSGTGQTALLTGHNAPERFGAHFGPWPPVRLRPLLESESLFRKAHTAEHSVQFANAYPAGYPGGISSRRVSAVSLAAHRAGVLTAGLPELLRGDALASEIVHDGWRRHTGRLDIPAISPEDAGRNLARISERADLTVFAHYSTDTAGHRGGMAGAIRALVRVDSFLGGLLSVLDPRVLLLIASDHGNIEDIRGGHTRNPALGLAVGPTERVSALPELRRLTDPAPAILEILGGRAG